MNGNSKFNFVESLSCIQEMAEAAFSRFPIKYVHHLTFIFTSSLLHSAFSDSLNNFESPSSFSIRFFSIHFRFHALFHEKIIILIRYTISYHNFPFQLLLLRHIIVSRLPGSRTWRMCCSIFKKSCLQHCLNHRILLDNFGCAVYSVWWHI